MKTLAGPSCGFGSSENTHKNCIGQHKASANQIKLWLNNFIFEFLLGHEISHETINHLI